MEILPCGCCYSKASIPAGIPFVCWYCKSIKEGKGTSSCWDYKVHRGFVYSDVTGKIRLKTKRDAQPSSLLVPS